MSACILLNASVFFQFVGFLEMVVSQREAVQIERTEGEGQRKERRLQQDL